MNRLLRLSSALRGRALAALEPALETLARRVERSPSALEVLRGVSVRGKRHVISRLRHDRLARDIVASCDGVNFRLDLADDVQREVYFNLYETADLAFATDRVPVGGTALDIGANVGVYSLHFARKVGPSGVVHAFEPDPANHARLVENCRLNDFGARVRVHRLALSDQAGTSRFFRSDAKHSGWGSLERFDDIVAGVETVETDTLDAFVARERLTRVDFAKIDVEAHELELFAGAGRTLKAHVIRQLMVEFNGIRLAEKGHTFDAFLQVLGGHGYAPTALALALDVVAAIRAGEVDPATLCLNLLFVPSNGHG